MQWSFPWSICYEAVPAKVARQRYQTQRTWEKRVVAHFPTWVGCPIVMSQGYGYLKRSPVKNGSTFLLLLSLLLLLMIWFILQLPWRCLLELGTSVYVVDMREFVRTWSNWWLIKGVVLLFTSLQSYIVFQTFFDENNNTRTT